MKYYIERDEYWPYLFLVEFNEHDKYQRRTKPDDIPADMVDWINRTLQEFEKVQAYLGSLGAKGA